MSLRVIVGDRLDLTRHCEGLSYSNVDPGGHETFTAQVPAAYLPNPGEQLDVWDSLTRVWHGLVEEPAETINGRRAIGRLSGVGMGARLKDLPFYSGYVHAKLTDWKDMRSSPSALLASGVAATASPQVGNQDGVITLTFPKDLPVVNNTLCGVYLDMGQNLTAQRIVVTYEGFNGDANWALYLRGTDTPDQVWASTNDATTQPFGGLNNVRLTCATPRRYIQVFLYRNGGSVTPTNDVTVRLSAIKVFAESAYESGDASILTPHTVVQDALTNSGAPIAPGVIEISPFVIDHLMYGDKPADADTILTDMGKLAAWHWGVWEPTWGDPLPRLDFRPPPTSATALVRRRDCTGLEIAEKRSGLYDSILVGYQTAVGEPGSVTVTMPNPRMPSRQSRMMAADMGVGDSSTATLYGQAVLGFRQFGNRGAGSPTLPRSVMLPAGGTKPAHHLQAGRDRLGIVDLPDTGPITDPDRSRFATFRCRRVNVQVTANGTPSTTVDIDGGQDLLDTLTARLTAVNDLVS